MMEIYFTTVIISLVVAALATATAIAEDKKILRIWNACEYCRMYQSESAVDGVKFRYLCNRCRACGWGSSEPNGIIRVLCPVSPNIILALIAICFVPGINGVVTIMLGIGIGERVSCWFRTSNKTRFMRRGFVRPSPDTNGEVK